MRKWVPEGNLRWNIFASVFRGLGCELPTKLIGARRSAQKLLTSPLLLLPQCVGGNELLAAHKLRTPGGSADADFASAAYADATRKYRGSNRGIRATLASLARP